jgi:hypothetical protein
MPPADEAAIMMTFGPNMTSVGVFLSRSRD